MIIIKHTYNTYTHNTDKYKQHMTQTLFPHDTCYTTHLQTFTQIHMTHTPTQLHVQHVSKKKR